MEPVMEKYKEKIDRFCITVQIAAWCEIQSS